MKCMMGHFGQPLKLDELHEIRVQDRQPAMIESLDDEYIPFEPDTIYYSEDELEASATMEKQLEAEAEAAKIIKTDAATAASQAAAASSPDKKEPNKNLIYGILAAIAALWYFNQD